MLFKPREFVAYVKMHLDAYKTLNNIYNSLPLSKGLYISSKATSLVWIETDRHY